MLGDVGGERADADRVHGTFGANAAEKPRAKLFRAAFAAAYGRNFGLASSEAVDGMLMIDPPAASCIRLPSAVRRVGP